MDESLIVVSIISTLGMIAAIELLNHNWFRREHFKVTTSFEKKSNDLKIKKLAHELGLSTQKAPSEPSEKTGGMGLVSAVLPELLKNMDPDALANIATNLIGNYGGAAEETEGGGGISDILGDLIANNPEMVKSFLEGFKGARDKNISTISQV